MYGFKFNDIHSSTFPNLIVNKIHRPFSAPRSLTFVRVPNRKGAYLQDINEDVIVQKIDITIQGDSQEEYNSLLDSLKLWLLTKKTEEFQTDKEVDRFGQAILDGSVDLKEIATLGEGTLIFVIPDGTMYGNEKSIPVLDGTIFKNDGTDVTFPTFRATINQPTTFLSIITPDDYMMVGSPVDVEEIEVVKEQTILKDSLTNTVGWTNGTTVLNGQVAGTMISDGNEFVASDYGTGSGWHGPALKKSFSEPLQDFRFEGYLLQSSQDSSRVGRVEFYLLDENNAVVARLGMRDSKTGMELNQGYISVHNGDVGKYIIYEEGNNPGVWNDFRGLLRLQRVGNIFTAYIAKQAADGSHYARRTIRFEDTEGKYLQRVAQVEIHIAAHGSSQTPDQQVREVRMYKINNPADQQIPYIAEAGDIIEFNHEEGNITKNGEPFLYEKDFAANYFALGKGETEIKILPEGVATVEMIYRPRWL
ncbi:hypothetical protein E1I69_20510 [Bacillus timonensis]|uniref:Phage tail family protein n=1 Tax=Bacillus timonensis TaxID=1033734 RepID=A0A4S3PMR3_9BACI|nr:distal tail protein Dit [Bacillus timonensis]THE09952.1 hypothetical protein E1I69_20510 [Bacillus timonensis]